MDPWLVYLLVFGFGALAAQQVHAGLSGVVRDRALAKRRFASLDPAERGGAEIGALRRRASRLGGSSAAAGLERWLLQTGTGLTIPVLLAIVAVLTLLLWPVVLLPGGPGVRLAAAGTAALLSVWLYLRVKRARRMARFGEQLPEVIDVVVRSLKAGHPLAVSLSLVAREMPEPAGPEFGFVIDEVSYGRSIPEALENLHDRVGYPELRFFVASTSVALQTGGNLSEILSRLARLLRERFRLARRVRALSAEGRFSGIALSALPVVLFGLINVVSAPYYAEFWTSPSAGRIVAVSLLLLAIGNGLIFRLVNFRV